MNSKRMVSPVVEGPSRSVVSSSAQQQVIKKSHSVRPNSALNERSSSVNSGLTSISVSNHQNPPHHHQASVSSSTPHQQEGRNENILCAVLALLKELGESELELVKRDIEKKILVKQQNHHY
jgi:hypothetical protein